MNKRFYRIVDAVMNAIYTLLYPARVEGVENIPLEGAFILCSNHISARDPFYLAIPCLRERGRYLNFMATAELFRFKPLGAVVRALGGFPVDRGHNDLNAVRQAMALLNAGHGLALFPQGTRSRDNSRTPMLTGASMIALRPPRAPVIPAWIDGPYRRFRPTTVRFGAPVDFVGLGPRVDSETLKAATGRIEDAVWGLASPQKSKK